MDIWAFLNFCLPWTPRPIKWRALSQRPTYFFVLMIGVFYSLLSDVAKGPVFPLALQMHEILLTWKKIRPLGWFLCFRGGTPPEKIHPRLKSSSERVFLNNFCWVPDSRHRGERGTSSRELFEKVRVNAVFFVGVSGFWVDVGQNNPREQNWHFPTPKKPTIPPSPQNEEFYGHRGFLLRKEPKIPGAHDIGAAISGPRIAGGSETKSGEKKPRNVPESF